MENNNNNNMIDDGLIPFELEFKKYAKLNYKYKNTYLYICA